MKIKLIAILIILSIFLSGCKNNPISLSSSNNTSEANASGPTATATPTPTPTPQVYLVNGETDFFNGDFDKALIELTSAQNSSDPEIIAKAMLLIGRISLQKQDFEQAVQKIGYLVNTQPAGDSRNTAFFFLAKSYEGLQEYQLAADAYQNYLNLITDSPLQADILEMMGDDLVSAGNSTAALPAFQKAIPLARPEYVEQIQIKAAQAAASTGDPTSAIAQYLAIYNASSNNYTKSTINLLLGRLYLEQGMTDEAYARFQDSVAEFPTTFDTYNGLVALVNANQPVDDLLRGLVDYYNGQYGLAIEAFDRYMTAHPDHDATPIYYKALSYYYLSDFENEVAQWDYLIKHYPTDANYADAFLEKASTQYGQLKQYSSAAQTLLSYVAEAPTGDKAAAYLYQAGRIYEQGNSLELAGQTWERVIQEYPAYEKAILAQFNAGICYYRLGEYSKALTTFQRNVLLTTNVADKARAELWIGKTQQKLNQKTDALNSFKQAALADPTGYYSIRANELLNNQQPFTASTLVDLGIDMEKEKSDAADWMRAKFNIASDVDLLSAGELSSNILYQRGDAFWKLGMVSQAQSEFETLRQQLTSDAANSFRLMNHMVDLGINQTAILCARQILDLIGLGDATLIDQTPDYFDHVRFGVYYREMIVSAANENNLNSLLLFSVIRQESMFEAEITSSQGASGLMQIMPAVGNEIVTDFGWPANYIEQDLTRPAVSIKLGAHYLEKWNKYFNQNMVAALAAYNGGIGYTMNWNDLSSGDPDLLLEIIPDNFETQNYIRYIRENLAIYETIYLRK